MPEQNIRIQEYKNIQKHDKIHNVWCPIKNYQACKEAVKYKQNEDKKQSVVTDTLNSATEKC